MIPKQENNNKRKSQWLSGVREMNGFIGIRWCRLVSGYASYEKGECLRMPARE